MINIIVNGICGKMGRVVNSIIDAAPDMCVTAGIDIQPLAPGLPFPVYTDISECEQAADCIIDFSVATVADYVVDYAVNRRIPLVMCTTGLSEATERRIIDASERTAVLRSANMSLGINTLARVLPIISEALAGAGFDIEIVEKHHSQKIDSPSGTAYLLADALNTDGGYEYVFDRSKKRERRGEAEIGIHAVRGGTIVGEHSVLFCGRDEVIEISHSAASKEVFAVGAVRAARYLSGKPAGLYSMEDVILET